MENGHRAVPLVVDGHLVRHDGPLLVNTVDKGLAPVSLIPAESLREPGFVQVVVLGVAHHVRLDAIAVHTHGKGAEPAPLLRVVVLHETDAAAAHVGVLPQHAIDDFLYLVRTVKVLLNDGGGIDRGDIEVGRDTANLLMFATHQTVAEADSTCIYQIVTNSEHQGCGDTHEYQHAEHDAPREPLGKRTWIARLLFIEK